MDLIIKNGTIVTEKEMFKADIAVKDQKIAAIGEKISVRRFVRYEMGEGLEKRSDNFAEEVASFMK